MNVKSKHMYLFLSSPAAIWMRVTCVTSGFLREVAANCALGGNYAANSGNFGTKYLSHRQGSRIEF